MSNQTVVILKTPAVSHRKKITGDSQIITEILGELRIPLNLDPSFDAIAEHDFSMFYFYVEYVQNRFPTHFLSVLMQCDVSPNSPVTPAVMPLSSHGSVK